MENPLSRPGKPMARIVITVAAGVFLLLLAHFIFSAVAQARSLAKRTACAANLSALGKGLHTYAGGSNQGLPIAPDMLATELRRGAVRYAPGMIGKHRETSLPATQPNDERITEMSTTRNLWILIRMGGSTPSSFICPGSEDWKDDEGNPQEYWDFRSYNEVSYGSRVPSGKSGKPGYVSDPRTVLAADKGPYGAALEAGKPHPGVPKADLKASAKAWQPWNSVNHDRKGQNVLYADSHADWASTPIAGPDYDNIYTRWSDPTGGTDADPTPRIHGTPPTGVETPFADTDSLIYP